MLTPDKLLIRALLSVELLSDCYLHTYPISYMDTRNCETIDLRQCSFAHYAMEGPTVYLKGRCRYKRLADTLIFSYRFDQEGVDFETFTYRPEDHEEYQAMTSELRFEDLPVNLLREWGLRIPESTGSLTKAI